MKLPFFSRSKGRFRKQPNMEMKYHIYALFDKISGTVTQIFISQTPGLAVRTILSTLRVPIRDSELYQIGEFNQELVRDELSSFDSCKFVLFDEYRLVSWDCYRFPEDVAEALSPLGCSPDEIVEISKNRIKNEVKNG